MRVLKKTRRGRIKVIKEEPGERVISGEECREKIKSI